MRPLLLALLIALLPLRGWVGDAMAMELLAPALAGPDAQAVSGHGGDAECEHAAPRHDPGAGAPAAAHEEQSAHAMADCASCTVCQICHTVALAAEPPPAARFASAAPMPAHPLALYASAEPAPGFKPPIS